MTEGNLEIQDFEYFLSDPDLSLLEDKLEIFNIMSILKISKSETTASSFLAWMLNPNEIHGIGTYFLKYFLIECSKKFQDLDVIFIDSLNLEEALITTEESFYGKRADITIRCEKDKFICIIENKIKSSESEGQTESYVELSEKKYHHYRKMFIYLTPSFKSASSKRFKAVSYHIIKDLLNHTINAKVNSISDEIIFFIKQFIQNLEVNILEEGEIRDICNKIYKKHKDVLEKIFSYRPDHMSIIANELKIIMEPEWKVYDPKVSCYIFKEEWLQKLGGFLTPNLPFFYYFVKSQNHGQIIKNIFYINEKKKRGGRFELREKFSHILDMEIENSELPPKYKYLIDNKGRKFSIQLLKEGYKDEEDLKSVAYAMKALIDITYPYIDNTIKILLEKYGNEIKKWQEELKQT